MTTRNNKARVVAGSILALIAPFAFLSTLLYVSRVLVWSTEFDDLWLALAVVISLIGIGILPMRWPLRIALMVLCGPIISLCVFYYMFLFVGFAFDVWL